MFISYTTESDGNAKERFCRMHNYSQYSVHHSQNIPKSLKLILLIQVSSEQVINFCTDNFLYTIRLFLMKLIENTNYLLEMQRLCVP